jgi:lysozyme
MNEELGLSPEGEKLVKSFESCMRKRADGLFHAYVCPAGKLTIGWGHTNAAGGRRFNANTAWTQDQCDAAFDEDMRAVEANVRKLVKVELTQHQFDALVSFDYNCGEGNLATSTLLKKVNRGDFKGAAREFARWNHGGGRVLPGLTRRRAAEALLFQNHNHETVAALAPTREEHDAAPMPQHVDPPAPAKPTVQSPTAWISGTLAAGGATEAIQNVNATLDQVNAVKDKVASLGVLDTLGHLASNPSVIIALIVAAAAVFIFVEHRGALNG